MSGHFWSCDKDGNHTIRSAVSENAMLHANLVAMSVTEPELWLIEVLHCGNRDFRLFLLLWSLPWPNDLHIWTWPILPGDIPDVQMWTSYVKAFENYHLTDRHDRNYITCGFMRGQKVMWISEAFVHLPHFTHFNW